MLMRRLRSQRTTQGLQDKRNDIARNEQARISLRTDARILFPEGVHDPSQAQVDAGRHERRSDSQADDLQEEARLAPRIGPGEDAAEVAEHLEGAAARQGEGEGRGAAGGGVREQEADEGGAEEGEEDGVGGEGWPVVPIGAGECQMGVFWRRLSGRTYVERSHVEKVQFANWSGDCRAWRVKLAKDIVLAGLGLERMSLKWVG